MRVHIFLLLCVVWALAFLVSTWMGWGLVLGLMGLLLFAVITVVYPDSALLFFLGARQVRSGDGHFLHEASAQEAYKLSLKAPDLYLYNGLLGRVFVLQHGESVKLVFDKQLLHRFDQQELRAVCFEQLIQAKKKYAVKRTRALFYLGFLSWFFFTLIEVIAKILPIPYLKKGLALSVVYFLRPILGLLFKLLIGERYFKKLQLTLDAYPFEKNELKRVGLKLSSESSISSLASKKILEFSSLGKSRSYQCIMSLEFLPHEWDIL